MANIFISYRRDDSIAVTGRICDRLKSHFGSESVFIDVDGIPFGVDFRQHLSNAVSKCDVVIAVIGENWLQTDQDGKSRLDNPADFVRVEIAAALARKIPVIPVLISRMPMPSADQLPPTLAELVYRNATRVDPGIDFNVHIERLIQGLDLLFRKTSSERSQQPQGKIQPASISASRTMIGALIFLVIAIIAALFGFSGVAGMATNIAWILFVVGLILFVVFLVMGRRSPPI